MAGIAPEFAAVLPLVIDVAVAVATTALVAVGDKPARRTRNAPSGATAPAPRSATPSRVTARSHRMVSAPSDAVSATALAAATASSATAQLAAELVAAKVTGQPVETVEAILVAHEDGDPLNRIAATLGVHHSAVKRILEAARHPPIAATCLRRSERGGGVSRPEGLHEVLSPSSARCTAAWQSRRLDGHVARSSATQMMVEARTRQSEDQFTGFGPFTTSCPRPVPA